MGGPAGCERARILFVDDEPLILNALVVALAYNRDWHVEIALGGEAGLAAIERGRFDVIVTDLHMPEIDGCDILAAAKAAHPYAVRVVLTGKTLGPDGVDADRVLTKPCTLAYLRSVIDEARAGRR
jgi:CheY-like chemotaxis protein